MIGMSEVLEFLAVVCTGLYAGYLLAFQTGVMPALREADDASFTAVMRTVNRKVPTVLRTACSRARPPGRRGSPSRRRHRT